MLVDRYPSMFTTVVSIPLYFTVIYFNNPLLDCLQFLINSVTQRASCAYVCICIPSYFLGIHSYKWDGRVWDGLTSLNLSNTGYLLSLKEYFATLIGEKNSIIVLICIDVISNEIFIYLLVICISFLGTAKHCCHSRQKYRVVILPFQFDVKEIKAFKQWKLDSCTFLGRIYM